MDENIFNIEKKIPLKDFSTAFTPYIRKNLDEAQTKQFLAVFVKHKKLMYKDRELLTWIQHISVLDASVTDLNVYRFLQYHFQKICEQHPATGSDIKSRALKYQKVSEGVAMARDTFIKNMMHIFETTGNQVP